MMKTQVPSTLSKNLRPMDAVKLPGRLTLNRHFPATQRVEKRPELAALISKIVQNWEYRLPYDVNY